jgi:hypothetical protein
VKLARFKKADDRRESVLVGRPRLSGKPNLASIDRTLVRVERQ